MVIADLRILILESQKSCTVKIIVIARQMFLHQVSTTNRYTMQLVLQQAVVACI